MRKEDMNRVVMNFLVTEVRRCGVRRGGGGRLLRFPARSRSRRAASLCGGSASCACSPSPALQPAAHVRDPRLSILSICRPLPAAPPPHAPRPRQGYVDAARVFERESGTAPGVDLDQITDRMDIRKAVQSGDVEQARMSGAGAGAQPAAAARCR